MTTYTRISKRLGWEPRAVAMPSVEEAKNLLEEVKAGNVFSFEKVFAIYRFAPIGEVSDAMVICMEAFQIGSKLFNDAA
jgi:hypothetical protein